MTGTGTKLDPYIILTAADLRLMESLGGSGVYFALGANIDFCPEPNSAEFQPILLNCAGLDGRGYYLRNILAGIPGGSISVFAIPAEIGELSITDLNLENAVIRGRSATLFRSAGTCTLELYHCQFLYMMSVYTNVSGGNEDGFFASCDLTVNMELCTVAARLNWNQQRMCMRWGTIKSCQFRLEVESSRMNSSIGATWAFFRYVTITDTCFFIKLNDLIGPTVSKVMRIAYTETTFANCYFVITSDTEITACIGGAISSPCFYDAESVGSAVITKTYTSDNYRLLGLTTAQCKNAEYLRSVGFVCGGGES
ncbi:MAG TPA: hypothetical protein PLH83_16710 [Ruminococcus sp.]|nr:hypothetical protein [Ruminococcus sp.]